MNFIKQIKLYLIFIFFITGNIYALVPIAKEILTNKKMTGAIVSLKVVQSVYNNKSEKLYELFKENVNLFPIEDLEKDIIEQNPNLILTPSSFLIDVLPGNEKGVKFKIIKTVHNTLDYFEFIACPAKYRILSKETVEYYIPLQGFTTKEIYHKRDLKKYFELFNVDVLLFVKVNIDSNYQGTMPSDVYNNYTIWVNPYHSARIMIIALDRNFKLVGYNPNFRHIDNVWYRYLNVFEGTVRDTRKLKYSFISNCFVLEDNEEMELKKMSIFFQEFYSNIFSTKNYKIRKNIIFTKKDVDLRIGLDLNISNSKKEMYDGMNDMKLFFSIL